MNEFENKVAIVIGTTGIGRAIAKRLVSGGASVTACGIDEAANRELGELQTAVFHPWDLHMVWSEPASDRLDGVIHRGLDHRAVEEAGRAGMGGLAGDCLYGDRIPISYRVGSYN